MEELTNMTQEEKDLLLKDLCARLPYGVFCEGITIDLDIDTDKYYEHKVKGVLSNIHHYKSNDCINTTGLIGLMSECELETIKPYLFPLSSMTEEQKLIYGDLCYQIIKATPFEIQNCFNELYNWLLKNNFDYQGLIPMGLAIDATNLNVY